MTTSKGRLSIIGATTAGVMGSISTTVVLSILSAIFISNEYFDINIKDTSAFLIQAIAALSGSYLSFRLCREGKEISSICCCAVYYLLLVGASIMLFEGISTRFWIGLISCFVGCLTGIVAANTAKKPRKQRNRSMRRR